MIFEKKKKKQISNKWNVLVFIMNNSFFALQVDKSKGRPSQCLYIKINVNLCVNVAFVSVKCHKNKQNTNCTQGIGKKKLDYACVCMCSVQCSLYIRFISSNDKRGNWRKNGHRNNDDNDDDVGIITIIMIIKWSQVGRYNLKKKSRGRYIIYPITKSS